MIDGEIVDSKPIEWRRLFPGGLCIRTTVEFRVPRGGVGHCEIWDAAGNLLATTKAHKVCPLDQYNVKAKG